MPQGNENECMFLLKMSLEFNLMWHIKYMWGSDAFSSKGKEMRLMESGEKGCVHGQGRFM